MFAVFAGEAEARRASLRELARHTELALAGIVLLLALALKRRRAAILVMANLPFALVGGVAGVALTGGDLSLDAIVGFVTLFGISIWNALMLIGHFDHLARVEDLPWPPGW